jgi:hypothetical protein
LEKDEIKKKIQLAVDSVADVSEPLKTKAFEIVLSHLLAGPSTKSPSTPPHLATELGERSIGIDEKIQKLAATANIETRQLKDIFHFGEKEQTFIGRIEGTEAEKQFQITQLVLLSSQEVYGHEWVKGSFLWKILKDYGVGSLDNLAQNLSTRPNEIRAMGQKRGRQYKLTEQGRQNAIGLLRRLAGQ